MHAAVFRPRMSEEAFQILLDVMDRRFAALSLPDTNVEHRLTRAISFTDLPDTRRIVLEDRLHTPGNSDTLVRQYSCEQIFNKNSNTRQVKVSQLFRAGNEEHKNTWEAIIPFFGRMIDHNETNVKLTEAKAVEDHCEYMETEEINTERNRSFLPFSSDVKMPNPQEPNNTHRKKKNSVQKIVRDPILTDGKEKPDNIQEENTSISNIPNLLCRPEYMATKSKLRPLAPKQPVQNEPIPQTFSFWKALFLLLIPMAVLIVSISINQEEFSTTSCTREFDFTRTGAQLQDLVYGQDTAIRQLIDHFTLNEMQIKIVAFMGGRGVGKSFSAHIIAEHFPFPRNIFQYTPPLQSHQRHASEVLSLCGCNLIVLENLGTKDILDAANFAESVTNHAKNYCITILAIFNVQETDENLRHKMDLEKSSRDIETAFREQGLKVKIIAFEALEEKVLEECILDAAREGNVTLSRQEIDHIKRGLLMADSGCKGAYAKVQLIKGKA